MKILTPVCFIFIIVLIQPLFAQEKEFKKTSIKTGFGLSINEGIEEIGVALTYSIGWQKSYGEKNKFRINPNLIYGGFLPAGITDTKDMFYRISNFGMDFHYDLLRLENLSLVTTAGPFINYSRGLIGTGECTIITTHKRTKARIIFTDFILEPN
jgi:hypothetical protein